MRHATRHSPGYHATRTAARAATYTTLVGAFFTLPVAAVATLWHFAAAGLGL